MILDAYGNKITAFELPPGSVSIPGHIKAVKFANGPLTGTEIELILNQDPMKKATVSGTLRIHVRPWDMAKYEYHFKEISGSFAMYEMLGARNARDTHSERAESGDRADSS